MNQPVSSGLRLPAAAHSLVSGTEPWCLTNFLLKPFVSKAIISFPLCFLFIVKNKTNSES